MQKVKLGTLAIFPIIERPDLLTPKVAEAIAELPENEEVGIAEIDPNLSDTAAFCKHYGVDMDCTANCIILEATRADCSWFAACVVLGSTRADVNGLARRTLDARRASFTLMEKAIAETGMEYGAITPIGLPEIWPILIDKKVIETEYVIIGSGIRKSKIIIPGRILASLPNAKILEELGQRKQLYA